MFNMFGISFGWPKASKCKKVIKSAQCRLIQLKNRKKVMAMQLRKDLAELIRNGRQETALNRVEQLIQDESLVAAYELLDHFFEFILKQLSYIRKHKDCPTDINEAVSSLIFASARCVNFPELYIIRKLFRQLYGNEFATAAVELFPGNLVNKKLIEKLSIKSVQDDLKYRVADEIARDNCLQPKVKGNQLVESDGQIMDTIEERERDVTSCVSFSSSITKPSDAFSLPESNLNDTSAALVSIVQQYPPYLTAEGNKCPKSCKDNLLRTYYSSTSQQPKHVHPKLPDYDNLVATFTALKRTMTPEETFTNRLRSENSPIALSPSCKQNGDKDGFHLPEEFNELVHVKELDFEATMVGNSFKKDIEAPSLRVGSSIAYAGPDYDEQETSQLRNMVRMLQEREQNIEVQLLEQETAVMELQNRLKINNMKVNKTLQSEYWRLREQVAADHAKVLAELDLDQWSSSSSQASSITDSGGECDDFSSVDNSSAARTNPTSQTKIFSKLRRLIQGKDSHSQDSCGCLEDSNSPRPSTSIGTEGRTSFDFSRLMI